MVILIEASPQAGLVEIYHPNVCSRPRGATKEEADEILYATAPALLRN